MKTIDKSYQPQNFEKAIYQQWEQSNSFQADSQSDKPAFSISMPPPNATGRLHAGHAVMLAVEDILVRWKRMSGFEVLWLPGTDHAAIATENVVISKIQKEEGIADPRQTLGREKLLEKIHEFVADSRDVMRQQIRAMGASCDWSRERFTMDSALDRCVKETFQKMFQDGLIYRGQRIVNWDPKLQTNVSDDEVEHLEAISPFYTFQYGPFQIGTVRPETKFGDKYVVVNPDDERYAHFEHGQQFECEWINGKVQATLIKDDAVDPHFGTGAMTITPSHDLNDFEIAQRHQLDYEPVIGLDGKLLGIANEFEGQDIEAARPQIVKKLESKGLLVKVDKDYKHSKAFNKRGLGVIEPQVREQWFVNVNTPKIQWKGQKRSFKEILLDVIHSGDIQITPSHFQATYFRWVDNLKDWCISRQIWWGHRIPVWYHRHSNEMAVGQAPNEDFWQQDPDTLDTWFSSALWTFSTLVNPKLAQDQTLSFEDILKQSTDLQKFHPTSVMETGYDILFFWVARMILVTTYMLGEVPFYDVYLHGLVRTKDNKKMSKSDPETCMDPLDSIEQCGADAFRLALIVGTAPGMDSKLFPEKIESCRRFTNKIWNAGRYVLMTLENVNTTPPTQVNDLISRWILSRLNTLIADVNLNLEKFRLAETIEILRSFLWNEFCDWYLEMSKKPERSAEDDHVLAYVYTSLLKLLHPYVPFVTETLWQSFEQDQHLVKSEFPQVLPQFDFAHDEAQISLIKEVISQIRILRDKAKLGLNLKIQAKVASTTKNKLFFQYEETIKRLARLESLEVLEQKPEGGLTASFQDCHVSIESQVVDCEEELKSLKKKLQKEQAFIHKSEVKLSNQDFLSKAPQAIVEELQQKIQVAHEKAQQLQDQIDKLQSQS